MSDQQESPFGMGPDQGHYPDPNSPFAGGTGGTVMRKRLLIVAVVAVAVVVVGMAGVMLASGGDTPAPSPSGSQTASPSESVTPGMVAMPDVIGLSLPDAASAVESLGLVVAEVTEQPGGGQAGTVLSQVPPAGTGLVAGGQVSLVIAAADATPVPAVTGLLRDAAEQALAAEGFTVGQVTEKNSSRPPYTVLQQSPASGTPAPRGSAIDLIVADAATSVPNVIGMPEAEAQAALESRGLIVKVKKQSSRQPEGTVVAVSPRVGVKVDAGTRVTITVAS